MPLRRQGCVVLLVCISFYFVSGGIFEYEDLRLPRARYLWERTALYSLKNTPKGSDTPFAKFDLSFHGGQKDISDTSVDVVFFHFEELSNIGFIPRGSSSRYLCCTKKFADINLCNEPGTVVFAKNANTSSNILNHQVVSFHTDTQSTKFQKTYVIEKTGVYYFFLVNCGVERENPNEVYISGKTIWKNPYGYMPGDEYGYFPFYVVLILVYAGMCAAWAVPSYIHRAKLVTFQHCISAIMLIGFFEASFYLTFWLQYNSEGHLSYGLLIFSVGANTLKRTLARLLLLIVCLGYGVISKEIKKRTIVAMIVYGTVYFIFSFASEVADQVQDKTTNAVSTFWIVLFFLPVIALDIFIYCWIGITLIRTLTQLEKTNETTKKDMYKIICLILIIALCVSGFMSIFEVFVVVLGNADNWWKGWWVWDSYWQVFYVIILAVIAFIWRPTSDNQKYSYVPLSDDPTEPTDLEMSSIGEQSGPVMKDVNLDVDNTSDEEDEEYSINPSINPNDGQEKHD